MQRTFIAIALCVLLAACVSEPGKGQEAEQRIAKAAPVIDALKRFHAKNGTYPESLTSLVPEEMIALPDIYLPSRNSVTDGGKYRLVGLSYELSFRYYEDGMNECIYQPRKGWICHGWI